MSRPCFVSIAVALLSLACGGEPVEPARIAAPSTSRPPSESQPEDSPEPEPEPTTDRVETSPTPSSDQAFVIREVGAAIDVGAQIVVHVRKTRSASSFTVEGPFTETVTVVAVESPMGGGGVNARLLTSAVAPLIAEGETVSQLRLRTPRVDQGMPVATASASLADSPITWLNSSVATDADGARHLFVDMHLAE